MHFVFLVEEPSAEAALIELLPKVFGRGVSFEIIAHQGKPDLIGKLPSKLRGYRKWLPEDWRLVVLVDEDRQDCRDLKAELEHVARQAGFPTKSAASTDGGYTVLNRLAIEELEAWFFGDVSAVTEAYPGVPRTLAQKAGFRDPDAVAGGTWEALQRVLQQAGYFPAGLAKIEAARSISRRMDVDANRSRSFQVFRDGIRKMSGGA